MADIPYGTDYPDAPWIDRDGHVLIDDGGNRRKFIAAKPESPTG